MSARSWWTTRARRVPHLAGRFFDSLRARPLGETTIASVKAVLESAEWSVWQGMSRPDRVEGVEVARRLDIALEGTSEEGDTRWQAAALVHDAGKQASGFGTAGRVVATTIALAVGDEKLRSWATEDRSFRARIGRYRAHDDLGAALLREAGARPEVAAWAEVHHRPEMWSDSGIPMVVCRALAAADGEPKPDLPPG